MNGFDPGASLNPATVTLKTPTAAIIRGRQTYIEADVSKPIPTFFLSAFESQSKQLERFCPGGGRRRNDQPDLHLS